MTEVSIVAPVGDVCGEGLIRQGDDLYWTDINRFLIHRLRPGVNEVFTWRFEEPVVALALTEDPDLLLVALASRLVFWRPKTGEMRDQGFHLEDYPRLRLNDGRAAPDGRFWVGSMINNVGPSGEPGEVAPDGGTLYAVGADGVDVLATKIGIPNTLCWAPEGSRFAFADTIKNDLSNWSWDQESGTISDPKPLLRDFERGFPDGSAMDSEGYVWNCRYGGGCIVRVSPEGEIDRVVDMPVSNITTCAFGGPENTTLYITTASAWPERFERLAGSLFSIEAGVTGGEEFAFRL